MSRLCIHTITTKPWEIEHAIEQYAAVGVKGISIWQQAVEGKDLKEIRKRVEDSGMEVVSYVRGGFFPSLEPEKRKAAIEHNQAMIEEAAALGAPLLVMVCGAEPRQSLVQSRIHIREGLEALIPHAQTYGVKLGMEPLHPMYADTRSAINTLGQANDIAEELASPWIGVVVDVYHLWWDPTLQEEILRCGKHDNLFAYHICDWRIPTEDMLNDRGLMGEGCIPLAEIGRWVKQAGFVGYEEVEIFSQRWWAEDQDIFLKKIVEAYAEIG